MQFNTDKYKELLIDFKINKHIFNPLSINASTFSVLPEAKILGITFSCDLSWKAPVTMVVKKANKR